VCAGCGIRDSTVILGGLGCTEMASDPKERLGWDAYRAAVMVIVDVSLVRPVFELIKEK